MPRMPIIRDEWSRGCKCSERYHQNAEERNRGNGLNEVESAQSTGPQPRDPMAQNSEGHSDEDGGAHGSQREEKRAAAPPLRSDSR